MLVRFHISWNTSSRSGDTRKLFIRIERALQPLRPRLSDAVYSRLVSALCLVIGWEALIVLSDVRGLTPEDRTQTSLWAARALIEAALTDPPASTADRRPGERRSAP